MNKILITGGSGLVGKRLTKLLLEKGMAVLHLSRKPQPHQQLQAYKWDIEQRIIDPQALNRVTHIVHLAGANLAEKRWTEKRKKIILSSRIDSAKLIFDHLKKEKHQVQSFISASGMSIYGDSGEKILAETDPPANDFLGTVCQKWEAAAQEFQQLGIKPIMLRIGLVLDKEEGALPKLAQTAKLGIGSVIGSGQQYYSWLHIDDLCRLIAHCIDHPDISGAYNTAAPQPVTNRNFSKLLAKALGRPHLAIPAPTFALRLMLGEMADSVLQSNRLSAQKILDTGFTFQYPQLQKALAEIYRH